MRTKIPRVVTLGRLSGVSTSAKEPYFIRTAELPVRILVTVTYLVMVGVNYMANALPLNGRETGVVSDAYVTCSRP